MVIVIGGAFAFYHAYQVAPQNGQAIEQRTIETLRHKQLPVFTVKDKNEQEVSSNRFVGKPVFMMEWASWCPTCQKMMPIIENVYKKYGQEIEFVLLNARDNTRETKESVQQYIKEKGYTFPYYFDDNLSVADTLQMTSIPTMLFIDKNGIIQHIKVAEMNQDSIESVLVKLLQGQ